MNTFINWQLCQRISQLTDTEVQCSLSSAMGTGRGLDRWGLLRQTWVQFPVPTWQLNSSLIPSNSRGTMPSSGLHGHNAHRWYVYIHANKTLAYTKKLKSNK